MFRKLAVKYKSGIKEREDAPDWTRTSMPIKAQALNLLCIPKFHHRGVVWLIILYLGSNVKFFVFGEDKK